MMRRSGSVTVRLTVALEIGRLARAFFFGRSGG
jgi:hypothetical protein